MVLVEMKIEWWNLDFLNYVTCMHCNQRKPNNMSYGFPCLGVGLGWVVTP